MPMLPFPPKSLSEEPAFLRGCETVPEVLNFVLIFDRLEYVIPYLVEIDVYNQGTTSDQFYPLQVTQLLSHDYRNRVENDFPSILLEWEDQTS
jgi:hypothetical protein